MKGYFTLRKKAIEILDSQLSDKLYYHGIDHTLDVLKVVNKYIERSGIPEREAKLLRLGTLYHDIGFTVSNEEHEKHSAEIARKHMEALHFDEADIEVVEGLIAATRIPQYPKNELEMIICDADLDYLGRKDFWPISDSLFKELKAFGKVDTKHQWNKIQISFLEKHSYHTQYAREKRQPAKEKRIKELKAMINQSIED
ncbi:HD domain-containing protein [Robertkochia flava]|uniref:HD domain-containing protein n=1 Tax=Robertkochia flava TaxID=3447986 RepID=UPI001CCF98C5|nr:HD domain-containing protein [Robertkochia marina]